MSVSSRSSTKQYWLSPISLWGKKGAFWTVSLGLTSSSYLIPDEVSSMLNPALVAYFVIYWASSGEFLFIRDDFMLCLMMCWGSNSSSSRLTLRRERKLVTFSLCQWIIESHIVSNTPFLSNVLAISCLIIEKIMSLFFLITMSGLLLDWKIWSTVTS